MPNPTRALRGASSAAGAADYALSLRYANGAFGTQRRLTGKGRFVAFEAITMDFDAATSASTAITNQKDAASETTWRLLVDTGALSTTPRSATELATAAGLVGPNGRPKSSHYRQVFNALKDRQSVARSEELRCGREDDAFPAVRGVLKMRTIPPMVSGNRNSDVRSTVSTISTGPIGDCETVPPVQSRAVSRASLFPTISVYFGYGARNSREAAR